MSADRFVVLGLAEPRAEWFRELARWSTTGAVPVEFVKCVSAAEVTARLRAGRSHSALLAGHRSPGLDRDLIDLAHAHGTTVIIVGGDAHAAAHIGAAASVASDVGPTELLELLDHHAVPVSSVEPLPPPEPAADPDPRWHGRLIAVTGAGGVGVSTTAMGLAHTLAARPGQRGMVALADLALDADQAMLHDTRELVPGVQELCEAHRSARPPVNVVRGHLFPVDSAGYHLLLGLRHHRDWITLRPAAFGAALDSLLRSYRIVVADVDADLEGEPETGSTDVEERNVMARTALTRAHTVVVVGGSSPAGVHRVQRTVRRLLAAGIGPERVVIAGNLASRRPVDRARWSSAVAGLLRDHHDRAPHGLGNPVFLSRRRDIERAVRDGRPLPPRWCRRLAVEVQRRLDTPPEAHPPAHPDTEPVAVVPGTLGAWSEAADA